jgi:hypothetical protein
MLKHICSIFFIFSLLFCSAGPSWGSCQTCLVREILEESDQSRFLSTDCSANLKKSVGLILAKASATEGLHPLDLSTLLGPSLPRIFLTRLHFSFLVSSFVYFCLRALIETRNTNPVGRICVFTSMFPAGEQRHEMRYSHWYHWRIRSIDTKLYWRRQNWKKVVRGGGEIPKFWYCSEALFFL